MQRLQAFKYELVPDGHQERQMRRFAGWCRFVFNQALALQKERYENGEKMSRKQKFSNNWKKAKARVQRIHSRIGNARRDFLHKTSTAIS